MTADSDLIIPLSQLESGAPDVATAPEGVTDPAVAGSLLSHVLLRHASALAGEASVQLVSLAVDVTGALQGGQLDFRSRLDRQTRTLIFINGEASEGGKPRLRATAIYRVSGR